MYLRPLKYPETMSRGKSTCKVLKEVRRKIADANGIPLQERECTHTGDCAGTCPYCESEVRYLERELSKRRALGKAVAVAGIAMLSVAPAAAQTPETSEAGNEPQRNTDPSNPATHNPTKPCDTYRMMGVVPQKDNGPEIDTADESNLPTSLDTIEVVFEPPEFAMDGTVSAPRSVRKDVWRFPSEYGTFKSFMHRQLKNNPELRKWLKGKTKLDHAKRSEIKHSRDPIERMMEKQWKKERRQYRKEERSSKYKSVNDNAFLLEFNQDGEVVDVRLRFAISGEEDERMFGAFYRIIDNMPRWTLNPKMSPPTDMIFQEYPYWILR